MAVLSDAQTLVETVQRWASAHGEHTAFELVPAAEGPALRISYRELDARARALAWVLHARGFAGHPVLVLCPAGFDYACALLGCFYAKAIAVPAYPPTRTGAARSAPRIAALIADSGARLALTTWDTDELGDSALHAALADVELLRCDRLAATVAGDAPPPPEGRDPALLQYTSGSTAVPRGVLVTHGQLLANLQMSRASGAMTADDVPLSWLPPYHDMGLMGGIFLPLFLRTRGVLMPPDAFLRRPRRWLTAIATHRATILMAPNFAFELCLQRISPADRHGLDLSSVRLAYNGAEPIRAATLDAFATAFEPAGFRREAFYPCYGMAEATLIVSGGAPGRVPLVRAYDAAELERGRAVECEGEDEPALEPGVARVLVGCGAALLDERIAIADPVDGRVLADRNVGEIWVQSRSVALGYWNQPELSAFTFGALTADGQGPFLRTGDLGFVDRGELFITGRLKDLIILNGRNHYPHDIERTVQDISPSLVADGGAAFSVEIDEVEQLVVVQELDRRRGPNADALLAAIPQAIRAGHEIAPYAVVLIKRGSLYKTSSGKVQRRATKQAFLAGTLQVLTRWERPRARQQDVATVPDLAPGSAQSDGTQSTRSSAPPAALRSHERPVPLRRQAIESWLREQLAARLQLPADEIDASAPLAQYGVDSLVTTELTDALERHLGVELPADISYDNPTIADLSHALARLIGSEARAGLRRAGGTAVPALAGDNDDPIAIVGMACRLPGAPSLASYWQLLRYGVDAIGEVPIDRWDAEALFAPDPGTPGRSYGKWGGFVHDLDRFDAAFFGISAREAARIDPQQRMFLELCWHALEDAGQSPHALAGSNAGVFAGVSSSEYALLHRGALALVDGDYGTGRSTSLVSNRVSYFLDLKGPSMTLDSACASSLVALQHACRSLRDHECELALAGGVNAVLSPDTGVYFAQLGALARDGRCKTFDARADGFVRSEGGGVLVLKRLRRALADGDRVYALIAGGAINHDGRSNGLLAPNGLAQQALLRRALASAGLSPDALDYVEAHGVGTHVADMVELRALGAVLGERTRAPRLRVGSVKTNLGHLEAASGIAGVIKVALALRHEELPRHLHLHDVHPDIGIDSLPIEIPTVSTGWRRGERPRYAGISAFGFGGTNAHVILGEAPQLALQPSGVERRAHLLTLSARSPSALRSQAHRLAHHLAQGPVELADVCFTTNAGRAHLPHRLALIATGGADARAQLEQRLHGEGDGALGQRASGGQPQLALLFADGPVARGTGRALYEQDPDSRRLLDACDVALRPHLGGSLLYALHRAPLEEACTLLARPSYAHAASATLQYTLYALWLRWGIEPAAIYGAGAGEYGAAAACGVIPFEEAVVRATRRGIALEGLVPGAERTLTPYALRSELAALPFAAPRLPLISAALGRAFRDDELPEAVHFRRQLYHVPAPDDGRDALLATGCDVWLELGCGGVLSAAGPASSPPLRVCSLGADEDDMRSLLRALASLHLRGVELDFAAVDAPYPRRRVSLPPYPFERERHWLDLPDARPASSPPPPTQAPATAPANRPITAHPLVTRMRVHAVHESGIAPAGTHDDRDEEAAS